MYNDTIKCENKIISNEDLTQIFEMMNDILKKYKAIYQRELQMNEGIESYNRVWSFKDDGSNFKVKVDFYDNTEITFDDPDNFMSIFYSRVSEIKTMDVHFSLNYSTATAQPNRVMESYYQNINIFITEKKMEITLKLNSQDPKLDDLYRFIKEKILNAPEKYDFVVKSKNKITNTIALATGIIPGLVISLFFLFLPNINTFFFKGFVVYPIISMVIGYMIGSFIANLKLSKYYANIMPEKIYAGHNSDGKSVYKDDIEKYVNTSEILIGKKVNNLRDRNMIEQEYRKYKAFLPKPLFALLGATVIVIIIGLFI